ncbi:hypothetical protein BV25DRAFT_1920518 [Artomyces pyxidatus]|uniref:Uncharacterized protein n=1 Tax=Artomyces pyxidatus TaxID=48021 RepID=A0ACB8SKL1_9AGAM|nr:hypothetical protein BV25DRAFT_1920518 [Artomyces pyxidatus]
MSPVLAGPLRLAPLRPAVAANPQLSVSHTTTRISPSRRDNPAEDAPSFLRSTSSFYPSILIWKNLGLYLSSDGLVGRSVQGRRSFTRRRVVALFILLAAVHVKMVISSRL